MENDLLQHDNTYDQNDDTFAMLKLTLQKFQSERLNKTYEDIKSDPEYLKMGSFFFEKLYSPKDFAFRDAGIKKLHKTLDGKVYSGMISAVTKVIELHDLSDRLDNLMVLKMMEFEIGQDMNMEEYQMVYKSLDNYDQRIYQINLGAEVTKVFHKLSKKWVVAISLNTVKKAAFFFKIREIIDFIYEGYTAFKTIKNIDFFLDTIMERELAWHNEIWSTDTMEILKK